MYPPKELCPLRWQALRRPDQLAILLPGQEISYRQLDCWVTGLAGRLERETKRGDTVAGIGHNSLEMVVLQLACLRTGRVWLPLSPRFPESQLVKLLTELDVRWCWVYSEALALSLSVEVVIKTVIATDIATDITTDIRTAIDKEAVVGAEDIVLDSDSHATLVLTSGSSGHPKAAAHSYINHFASASGSAEQIPFGLGDRWLLSLPLFHIGGMAIVFRALYGAGCMVLAGERELREVLQTMPVSHLSLVNTQLYRLLNDPSFKVEQTALKYLLLGGGVISVQLVEQLAGSAVQVFASYGLTEAASQVCTGPVTMVAGRLCTGHPLTGRELRIGRGKEIQIRGSTLFKGYYRHGKITPLPLTDGWFGTGDLGQLYPEGLVVEGRRDNMLISGGENIQPEEIEQALLTFPDIVQAVVVAVASDEFGHRPVAFIQTVNGLSESCNWRDWLAGKVAGFKIPDYFWEWPQSELKGLKPSRRRLQVLAERYLANDRHMLSN